MNSQRERVVVVVVRMMVEKIHVECRINVSDHVTEVKTNKQEPTKEFRAAEQVKSKKRLKITCLK